MRVKCNFLTESTKVVNRVATLTTASVNELLRWLLLVADAVEIRCATLPGRLILEGGRRGRLSDEGARLASCPSFDQLRRHAFCASRTAAWTGHFHSSGVLEMIGASCRPGGGIGTVSKPSLIDLHTNHRACRRGRSAGQVGGEDGASRDAQPPFLTASPTTSPSAPARRAQGLWVLTCIYAHC